MSSANPEETAPAPSALTGDVMRAVVDAAPDGLLIVDENGRIALVNSQVESLFGYHRGDLLGREIYQAAGVISGSTWTAGDVSRTQFDVFGQMTGRDGIKEICKSSTR